MSEPENPPVTPPGSGANAFVVRIKRFLPHIIGVVVCFVLLSFLLRGGLYVAEHKASGLVWYALPALGLLFLFAFYWGRWIEFNRKAPGKQTDLIPKLGTLSITLFFVSLLMSVLCACIYFIDVKASDDWLRWSPNSTTPGVPSKGPFWFAFLPQLGIFLGALFGGFIWARNWEQKHKINEIQEGIKTAQEGALNHQKNVLLDQQNQFQRRILEERFNRILDDFAHSDPATRAGAASRFVSIAQERNPSAEHEACISEKNNPFFMPAVRQLVQRLVMEPEKRVGKAILEAFIQLTEWTAKEVNIKRASLYDDIQPTILNLLGEVNRVAHQDWIEALAKNVQVNVSPSELEAREFASMHFDEALYSYLESGEFWALPDGFDWYGNPERDQEALIDHFGSDTFRRCFHRTNDEKESDLAEELDRTKRQLQFTIDATNKCLELLRRPNKINLLRDRKIRLERVFLPGLDLGAKFMSREPSLMKISFNGTDLRNSNFNEANLEGAKFVETKLQWANLERAKLRSTKLDGAILNYATLQQADLRHASLKGACFDGACLRWANLQNADFEHAELDGADMKGAFVKGSNLILADILPVSALMAEYREAEWDQENQMWESPGRPMDKAEYRHYLEVKQKLIDDKVIPLEFIGPHDLASEPEDPPE